MQIELKNIKFSEAMSEETNAFVCDVYVNKVKVAYAKNDGHGGCTFYHAYEGKRELIEQAEKFCKALPPLKYGGMELPMNLEMKIGMLLEDWLKAKDQAKFDKKLQKDMLTGLCIKTANGYTQIVWNSNKRNKITIAEMVSVQNGRELLKKTIAQAKAEGKEVLNTNIPQHLF
jgi:hypothetical protein